MNSRKESCIMESSRDALKKKNWSEEEEYAILDGAIKFIDKKGVYPGDHMNAFFRMMVKIIDPNFTKQQLSRKFSRLKRKFENNAKEGGVGSGSPREQKLFELSKRIWGQSQSQTPDITFFCETDESMFRETRLGVVKEEVVEELMELIGENKRKEFVEQWKQLHTLQLKLSLKRLQLLELKCKMLLAASR